ncbi:helix-turn-helix domain-containing protein [Streptomyces sp. NBC_01707]|uniref:helix-turn-helix domain-containing protein n=1 Tax=unclassified Streptomyces TaxID=2593676 RepID=UPI002E13074A|nr:helix-turn-helix domain-containing protein [Streptomyces sp. NBC_01230]
MLLLRTDLLLKAATAAGQKTPSGIAQRIGVKNSTMWRLIAGRTTPSLSTLVALSEAYEISLDDLVHQSEAA